jgi:hypothetical protein
MTKIRIARITYTFFLLLIIPQFGALAQENEVKNILFVIVDDLRLQAGIFGQGQMITPNLDKLGQ